MEQEYEFTRDDKLGQLIMQEYIKMDRGLSLLLCKETYELKLFEQALQKQEKIILLKKLLRTKNIYPPETHMGLIIEAVMPILERTGKNSVKISLSDKEFNIHESLLDSKDDNVSKSEDNTDNGSVDIDKLMVIENDPQQKDSSK